MGLFNFLKKKETRFPVRQIQLKPTELKNWINTELSEPIEEIRKRAKELYNSVTESIASIRASVQTLGEAEFGNKREYAMVNMAKDSFVKRAYNIMKKFTSLEALNYNTIKEFHKNSMKSLEELKNIPPKQAISITRYFPSHANKMINSLKQTESRLESLNAFLLEDAGIWNKKETLERKIERYIELEANIEKLKSEEAGLKEKIKNLKVVLKRSRHMLKNMEEGNEYRKYKEVKEQTSKIKTEMESIKSSLMVEISSIRRPLKKLRHKCKNQLINQAISKPLSIIAESKEDELIEILKHIGNTELKEKEKKKIADFMEKAPEIKNLKNRYLRLKELKKQKTEKLESMNITGRMIKIKDSIRSTETKIKETETELENLIKETEKSERNLTTIKADIEKLVYDLTKKKIMLKHS